MQKATHVAKAASAVAAAAAGCTSSLPPPLLLTNSSAAFVNDPETGALVPAAAAAPTPYAPRFPTPPPPMAPKGRGAAVEPLGRVRRHERAGLECERHLRVAVAAAEEE